MQIKLCLVLLAMVAFCQNAKAEDKLKTEILLQIIYIKDGKILSHYINVNDSVEFKVEGYVHGLMIYSKEPCDPYLSDNHADLYFKKADKGLGYFENYLKEEIEFLDESNVYGIFSGIRAGPLSGKGGR
jgi:hypothetical protein